MAIVPLGVVAVAAYLITAKVLARRANRINRGKPNNIGYEHFFNCMQTAEEVRQWVKKDYPEFFGEWPRDSGGFRRMLEGMKASRHSAELSEDIKNLEYLWFNADKTSCDLSNYNSVTGK